MFGASGEATGAKVLHYDGTTWESQFILPRSLAMLANTADDAVTVGVDGSVASWDGLRWTEVSDARQFLDVARIDASDDIWGLSEGLLYHFDGTSWTMQGRSAPSGQLFEFTSSVALSGGERGTLETMPVP